MKTVIGILAFALPVLLSGSALAQCVAADSSAPDVITCGLPADMDSHHWTPDCETAGTCSPVNTMGLMRYVSPLECGDLECVAYRLKEQAKSEKASKAFERKIASEAKARAKVNKKGK